MVPIFVTLALHQLISEPKRSYTDLTNFTMLPHRHPTVCATAPTTYDLEAFALLKQDVEALEIALLRFQVDTLRQQIAALQFIILPSAFSEDIIEVNPFCTATDHFRS